MMDFNIALLQWPMNFFDKNTSGGAATHAQSENLDTQNKSTIKNEIISCK